MSSPPACPSHFGVLLFPGFQAIDVFGGLDILNTRALNQPEMTISMLSRTLDPVTTIPPSKKDQKFGQYVVPTHTFSSPPDNLEVLIVPGGLGYLEITPESEEVQFIKRIFPKLKYFITVCTGSGISAMAGVLDGKRATGNKAVWNWNTSQGPKTHWVAKARWVQDGNIWTTSGVSAGMDGVFNFVKTLWGESEVRRLVAFLEYRSYDENPSDDPWCDYYGCKDVPPKET